MKELEDAKKAPQDDLVEDDMDFEPEEELGSIGAAKAKLSKLKAELEKAKSERQEYLDGWQRAKADAVNSRKDMAAESLRQSARAKEAILEDVLPALDSFDMAYSAPSWEAVDPVWRNGIDQIRNQLLDVMTRNGFERYGAVGEAYSPFIHEAVQELSSGPGQPGAIVRVLRAGYRAGDRILRPAQVVIRAA